MFDEQRDKFDLDASISSVHDVPVGSSNVAGFHEPEIDEGFELQFAHMRVHIHRDLYLVVLGQNNYFIVSLDVLFAVEEDGQLHLQSGCQAAFSGGLDGEGVVGGLLYFDFLAGLAHVSDVDGDLV